MNIRDELRILLIIRGTTMHKLVQETRGQGYDIPKESTLSASLKNKRIRYQTVSDILEYMGYEIVIKEKNK